MRFSPFATAVGVFSAVVVPIVVIGYSRSGGHGGTYVLIGVVVGLIAGIVAGLWVAHRGGQVWRGPRL